jgi:lipopolysaccharide/colanic/teichoic acid biosynthesis glycosyltransferase
MNPAVSRPTSSSAHYPPTKSLLDKVVSAALLVLLSPVLLFVLAAMAVNWLAVRRDRGPFLYHEKRLSMGEEFDLLKFRTLRRAALTRQAGEEAHARLLEADEQNLTWAGRRILKPWYLDELPQLLNVVKGDMSLVGPRPWPPSLAAAQLERGLTYRNEVPAGWTGLAQVQKDLRESSGYAELDLAYVEACRRLGPLALARYDLGILWQTVKLMARGEGLRY